MFGLPNKIITLSKWIDLDEMWYVGTYVCPEGLYAAYAFEKFQDGHHDVNIADFSKWSNLL